VQNYLYTTHCTYAFGKKETLNYLNPVASFSWEIKISPKHIVTGEAGSALITVSCIKPNQTQMNPLQVFSEAAKRKAAASIP